MCEVVAGCVVGVLIVTTVCVVTFAVMFPFEFEVEKLLLEEVKIELEVEMLAILILFEENFK